MRNLIRIVAVFGLMVVAGPLAAQQDWKEDLKLLADKAEESVEVKLDRRMLELAAKFLSSEDAEEREIRDIVRNLNGIYIYSFTFDRDWKYDKSIAETIRRQIGKGWEPMITVRSKSHEDVDVWVRPGENDLDGIFIIAAEPREFTIVHISGSIDIDKLSRLEGQFGIPDLEIETTTKIEKGINR